MTDEIFTALAQSAAELKRMDLAEDVWAVKERYDRGMYCIALIGQFSAGKSSLLNNILGRDILPHGRQETTAVLTFISGTQEGEEEGAQLHYKNGESRPLSLEEIKNISQQDSIDDWNLEDAYSLDIHLDAPLLKKGLVLLDTPGVNTMIERHELLLAYALKASSHVIYVSQGAPSSVDIEKLLMLQDMGIPVSYVRTHFDEIQSSEENPTETMEKDRVTLSDCGVHLKEGEIFHISNLPDSPWFGNINGIRTFLTQKGEDVKVSMEEDTSQRLNAVVSIILPKMEDVYQTLQARAHNDAEALTMRRQKLEDGISGLEQSLERHQKELEKEIQSARHEFDTELRNAVRKSVDQLSCRLNHGDTLLSPAEVQNFMQLEWKNALNDIQRHMNSTLNPVLETINGSMPVPDESLSIEDMPEAESYEEVVQTQDAACERLKELLENIHTQQQALSKDTVDLSSKKAELEERENALQEAIRAYDARDPYVPRKIMVSPGSTTGSQIGKGVGAFMDLAMLFLPTPAGKAGAAAKAGKAAGKAAKSVAATHKALRVGQKVVKGTNVAKVLLKLEKNAKLGRQISKAAKAAKKTANTVLTAENISKHAKEAAETINTMKEIARKSEDPSILDYLTLEYWGEKVGSCFDEPPRYDIDRAYEAEYEAEKRRLEEEKKRAAEERFRREEEYGLLKSREEKRQRRLELLKEEEKNARNELLKREDSIRRAAAREARDKWYKSCITYYESRLSEVISDFGKAYLSEMPKRLQQYQAQRFRLFYERIRQQKEALESLDSASPDEIRARAEKIGMLVEKLKAIQA